VREMVRRVAERYPDLRGGGFICARQENLETIHRHSVVAERTVLFDEVLAELETGERSGHHVTEREWLEAPCSASIERSPKK
jgi:GTP cyclohydrolase-4